MRLGYFANVTHAQPQVAVQRGTFDEFLGDNVTLETKTFNAGPDVITAIFAGELDASYIGPNPAINGFVQSDGEELRIIAGATSGGARLIVRPGREHLGAGRLREQEDRDAAAREHAGCGAALVAGGQRTERAGAGRQRAGAADGERRPAHAVPERRDRRRVGAGAVGDAARAGGGRRRVPRRGVAVAGRQVRDDAPDRADGVPRRAPGRRRDLLRAHVETTEWINANPEEAKTLVNQSIEEITSKPLAQEVIDSAWENIEITYDPVASSLYKSAEDACGARVPGRESGPHDDLRAGSAERDPGGEEPAGGIEPVRWSSVVGRRSVSDGSGRCHCTSPAPSQRGGWTERVLARAAVRADSRDTAAAPLLSLQGVSKRFVTSRHDTTAIQDIDLDMREGEFVCVVGPSGCGKSTLLNIIAGLDRATQGRSRSTASHCKGSSADRVVVFQDAALYPWLNVRANVEFGLKMKGISGKRAAARSPTGTSSW